MKKIAFIALLFAGLTSAGFSQERPTRNNKTPEERAQHMTEALDKKLSLSEKQRKEIYKINLERAKGLQKRHASVDKRNKKDFEKERKQFEKENDKIKRVLNNEQRKKFDQLKAQRKNKARGAKGEFSKNFRERGVQTK